MEHSTESNGIPAESKHCSSVVAVNLLSRILCKSSRKSTVWRGDSIRAPSETRHHSSWNFTNTWAHLKCCCCYITNVPEVQGAITAIISNLSTRTKTRKIKKLHHASPTAPNRTENRQQTAIYWESDVSFSSNGFSMASAPICLPSLLRLCARWYVTNTTASTQINHLDSGNKTTWTCRYVYNVDCMLLFKNTIVSLFWNAWMPSGHSQKRNNETLLPCLNIKLSPTEKQQDCVPWTKQYCVSTSHKICLQLAWQQTTMLQISRTLSTHNVFAHECEY